MNKEYIKKRSGCSFKGYVYCEYKTLIEVFGEPTSDGDGYKVDAEWLIDTSHGPATIYNYKDGKAYLGNKGIDTTLILEWHVGAKDTEAYKEIKVMIEKQILHNFESMP